MNEFGSRLSFVHHVNPLVMVSTPEWTKVPLHGRHAQQMTLRGVRFGRFETSSSLHGITQERTYNIRFLTLATVKMSYRLCVKWLLIRWIKAY